MNINTEVRPARTGSSTSNITWSKKAFGPNFKICWGTATAVRNSAEWGNIFYSGGSDESWYYPSDFFTETPVCIMTIQRNEGGWILTNKQGTGTKEYTPVCCPASAVSFTNATIVYEIIAFGK